MAKIEYVNCVTKDDMKIIRDAIPILDEYAEAGFRVTQRQLFYQLVSRGLSLNNDKMYKRMCKAIVKGRMSGLIDWNVIEDRTRPLRQRSHWGSPSGIVEACAQQYHTDYWQGQKRRVELWIEKDALLGIVEATCLLWDCPYWSCRGYSSRTGLHEAALRIKKFKEECGQGFKILYAGDHDPSKHIQSISSRRRLDEYPIFRPH